MLKKKIILCMLLLTCIWGISRLLFPVSVKSVEIINRLIDLFMILLAVINLLIIRYIFILFLRIKNEISGEVPVKSIILCLVWGIMANTLFCFLMLPFWMYAFIPVALCLYFVKISKIKWGILFVLITFIVTLTGILSIPFFFWLIMGCVTAFIYKKPRWIHYTLCGTIAAVFIAISFTGLFVCHEIEKDDDQHLIYLPYYTGADVHIRFFSTPLSGLAGGYLVGPAKLLLQAGADPGYTDDAGRTALYEASRTGSVKMMALLLDYGAGIDGNPHFPEFAPITGAIWRNDTARIQFFVEQGASFDNKMILDSAIHSYRDPEILTILLELGAPVNVQNDWGDTPLHCAVSLQRPPVVLEILIAHGADPNLKNSSGQTPLDYAVMMENNPAKEYLEGIMGIQE
ncbi:MAG: ankyrin repeat domain-containing protein [Spirochaetales bacterium]|nr:ankyrin repeat domain-containing protein [Spirochaetales bacterium]